MALNIVFLCITAFSICCVLFLYFEYKNRFSQLKKECSLKTTDLEEQVEASRVAVKAKGDFLAKVSHEIRTPLNAIMGMTQIIQNTTELKTINDCTDKMERSSRHLLGIINDILDMAKMESGKFILEENLFSLTRELEFVLSMFAEKAEEKGIALTGDIKGINNDGIVSDKLRLNQVLINLMSNAVKFTDSGGAVKLTAKEVLHIDGESVYSFTVTDNGIGIKPEQARKLFTPFTQAHDGVTRLYGGTGLGLSIARNIVQTMGGEIELETEFGKGSTFGFTIRVPAKERAEDSPACSAHETERPDYSEKRVLVVDDNGVNLDVAKSLLKLYGVKAETVKSGKQAIELIQESQYDIVFMDHMMPGMDGVETTKAIRELGIDVTIIALTACAVDGERETMLEAGMDDYMSKPILKEDLRQMLKKWLVTNAQGHLNHKFKDAFPKAG